MSEEHTASVRNRCTPALAAQGMLGMTQRVVHYRPERAQGRGKGCWSVSVEEKQNRGGRIRLGLEGCKHDLSSVEGRGLVLSWGAWPG